MRLWTIQTSQRWTEFERTGVLRATRRHAPPDMLRAYDWMIARMRERIGPPPHRDASPIWAWFQYDGVRHARPDLRQGGWLPSGTQGVRIEFEADPKTVLLSEFILWHHPLNNWTFGLSEEEDRAFDQSIEEAASSPKPAAEHARLQSQKAATWPRIFDLDWTHPDWTPPREEKSIQACLWEVRIEQVKAVKLFRCR